MPFAHGLGWVELVIILVVVMIVFGVGRLPEVGGAMGKALREFRSSVSGKAEKDAAGGKKKKSKNTGDKASAQCLSTNCKCPFTVMCIRISSF